MIKIISGHHEDGIHVGIDYGEVYDELYAAVSEDDKQIVQGISPTDARILAVALNLYADLAEKPENPPKS